MAIRNLLFRVILLNSKPTRNDGEGGGGGQIVREFLQSFCRGKKSNILKGNKETYCNNFDGRNNVAASNIAIKEVLAYKVGGFIHLFNFEGFLSST